MQRRVSLVVSEQSSPTTKKSSHTNLFNSMTSRNNNLKPTEMAHSESVFATTHPSCTVFNRNDTFHNNHLQDLRHKLANTPKQMKMSLDDLDILHDAERLGSIPMVGSLIYYKRKNEDIQPNHHNNTHNNTTDLHHPTPTEKTDSNESIHPPELKVFRHFSSPEILKGHHIPHPKILGMRHSNNSTDSTMDNESAISDYSYSPENTEHTEHTKPTDEFSMINSKIHSQIKRNTAKFNNFIHEQREKSKFRRHNFHIPGIDPEVSASEEESLKSVSLTRKSNSSPHLTNVSTDSLMPPDSIETYTPTLQPTASPNSKHRRRLTCAMIFTAPKVVEI